MVQRHFEHALVRMHGQGDGGPLDPQPLDEAEQRLSGGRLEDPVEMEGREGGDARQAREGELLGEMSTNMIDDAVDPLLVLDPVRAGHGSKNLR